MPKVFIQGVVDASPLDVPPGGGGGGTGIWGPPDMPPGFWGGGMGPGVKPQPPAGAHPEHPIYIPVDPPADSGLSPEHPIYIPIYPAHPIVLPPDLGLSDEQKEKLRQFLEGNLPPFHHPQPIRGR